MVSAWPAAVTRAGRALQELSGHSRVRIPGTPNSIWPSLSASFLGKRMSFLLCDARARPGLCADKRGAGCSLARGSPRGLCCSGDSRSGRRRTQRRDAKMACPAPFPTPPPVARSHLRQPGLGREGRSQVCPGDSGLQCPCPGEGPPRTTQLIQRLQMHSPEVGFRASLSLGEA